MPRCSEEKDAFDDALLESFGVTSIRINGGEKTGSEVEVILKRAYLSVEGVDEQHWNEARKGSWKRK